MIKNLKLLRTQRNISQQALADKIGISQQSVNKYENHKIEPDIATLIAIADYFDTTVDYLIGRVDENGKKLNKSDTDVLMEKYALLGDRERKCVEVMINTFYEEYSKK